MRKYILILVTMLTILVLVACGTNTGNSDEDPVIDRNETPIVDEEDPIIENNENEEDLQENNDEGLNEESENTNEDLITETGIYNGQADPHTIEIENAEGATAFQLTMEARDDIDGLTEGKEVTYTYTEEGDTRTIESIELAE